MNNKLSLGNLRTNFLIKEANIITTGVQKAGKILGTTGRTLTGGAAFSLYSMGAKKTANKLAKYTLKKNALGHKVVGAGFVGATAYGLKNSYPFNTLNNQKS